MSRHKRHRGGQPGNQNARKHGFYSTVITARDKADLKQAIDVAGIDEEIALFRVKLKAIYEKDPDNIELIMHVTITLARLLRTRRYIGAANDANLRQALGNVLRDVALPLGIKFLDKKLVD